MKSCGVECTGCKKGINMCHNRTCMGGPREFSRIIDAGFADKLHLDYYSNKTGFYAEALAAAIYKPDISTWKEDFSGEISYETTYSHQAPWWPIGRCVLLTEDNKCSLHDLGLKPQQGRQACCKVSGAKDNYYYFKKWDTKYGRSIVEKWKKSLKDKQL